MSIVNFWSEDTVLTIQSKKILLAIHDDAQRKEAEKFSFTDVIDIEPVTIILSQNGWIRTATLPGELPGQLAGADGNKSSGNPVYANAMVFYAHFLEGDGYDAPGNGPV